MIHKVSPFNNNNHERKSGLMSPGGLPGPDGLPDERTSPWPNPFPFPAVVSILLLALLLPLFFLFLDQPLIIHIKAFLVTHPELSALYSDVDPIIKFMSHGLPQFASAGIIYLAGFFFYPAIFTLGRDLFFGLISTGLAVQVVKHLVGRARPRITSVYEIMGPTLQSSYDSFPSGHTAASFCIASVLSMRFPKASPFFYFLALLAGLDRIKSGSHFPSDVLAGAALGILFTRFVVSAISQSRYKLFTGIN